MLDLNQALTVAVDAAQTAAERIRADVVAPPNIREKSGPRDLVTDTDHAAQDTIISRLESAYPDHAILAEENPRYQPDERGIWTIPPGYTWIIDPVDGTTNFSNRLPMFSISIGLALDGDPVLGVIVDPMRDEIFTAIKGQGFEINNVLQPPIEARPLETCVFGVDWAHAPATRRHIAEIVTTLAPHTRSLRALGSAALGLAYVASGRLQVYANGGLKPWDVCAGAVMLNEIGVELRHLDGRPFQLGTPGTIAGHAAVLNAIFDILPPINKEQLP